MDKNIWQELRERARQNPRRIILPEGEDDRILQAAVMVAEEGIAEPFLVGSSQKIQELAKKLGISTGKIEILDIKNFPDIDKLAEEFYNLRKHKGVTPEVAREEVKKPLNFAALLTRKGRVDGFVGGATHSTADTVRAALWLIGLAPNVSTLFSYFVIETLTQVRPAGKNIFIFADCGVIPDPKPKQLANIARGAAQACRVLLKQKPRVALLSFSTKGSAEHESVKKIIKACEYVRQAEPDLAIDGELQVDAAVVVDVAGRKANVHPEVAGQANVLIFPDLNSGNIAYKIIQRLGGARAVGPVLFGPVYPANDLSRGCSVEDIVDAVAITVIQAQKPEDWRLTPLEAKIIGSSPD